MTSVGYDTKLNGDEKNNVPLQDQNKETNDNIIAARVIITLAVFIGFLIMFIISGYYCYKKRKLKPYHYSRINDTLIPINTTLKPRPKLKISIPVGQPKIVTPEKQVYLNKTLQAASSDDKFLIPPKTPDTPVTPNMPYRDDSFSYSYNRSISAPAEKVYNTKDGDILWRSAINKSTINKFLGTKPKVEKKISHCANGKIKLSLKYNQNNQKELSVQILDFVDLPLCRETGISNPYVKVYLYPQTAHSYGLNETKKNCFRVEVLSFPVDSCCSFNNCPIDKLCSSALKFVILDYDRFSRSEFVADCVILLDEVSLEGESITKHLSIRKTHPDKDIGSLLISLCYQPGTSRMSIIVLKSSGLPATDSGHSPDHFVKISLMRSGNILDKRRTRVIKKSVCPVFNERLVFPVDSNSMRSLVLIFDVIKYDSKIKQEKIGTVILGNHSIQRQVTPHEIQHFNEILQSPQRQLAEWHQLII